MIIIYIQNIQKLKILRILQEKSTSTMSQSHNKQIVKTSAIISKNTNPTPKASNMKPNNLIQNNDLDRNNKNRQKSSQKQQIQEEVMKMMVDIVNKMHKFYIKKGEGIQIYRDLSQQEQKMLEYMPRNSHLHGCFAGILAIQSCVVSIEKYQQFFLSNILRTLSILTSEHKSLLQSILNNIIQKVNQIKQISVRRQGSSNNVQKQQSSCTKYNHNKQQIHTSMEQYNSTFAFFLQQIKELPLFKSRSLEIEKDINEIKQMTFGKNQQSKQSQQFQKTPIKRQKSSVPKQKQQSFRVQMQSEKKMLVSQLKAKNESLQSVISQRQKYILELQSKLKRQSKKQKESQIFKTQGIQIEAQPKRKIKPGATLFSIGLRQVSQSSENISSIAVENKNQQQYKNPFKDPSKDKSSILQSSYQFQLQITQLKQEIQQKATLLNLIKTQMTSQKSKHVAQTNSLLEQIRILKKYNDLDTAYLLEQLEFEMDRLRDQKMKDQKIIRDLLDDMESNRNMTIKKNHNQVNRYVRYAANQQKYHSGGRDRQRYNIQMGEDSWYDNVGNFTSNQIQERQRRYKGENDIKNQYVFHSGKKAERSERLYIDHDGNNYNERKNAYKRYNLKTEVQERDPSFSHHMHQNNYQNYNNNKNKIPYEKSKTKTPTNKIPNQQPYAQTYDRNARNNPQPFQDIRLNNPKTSRIENQRQEYQHLKHLKVSEIHFQKQEQYERRKSTYGGANTRRSMLKMISDRLDEQRQKQRQKIVKKGNPRFSNQLMEKDRAINILQERQRVYSIYPATNNRNVNKNRRNQDNYYLSRQYQGQKISDFNRPRMTQLRQVKSSGHLHENIYQRPTFFKKS